MSDSLQQPIEVGEINDPADLAAARARREQFDRNWAWLQARAPEVYSMHRGKCISVAGEQLFVAGTAKEALAQASAAHPEDQGVFVHYIPHERVPRIYANRRRVV